uniref:Uncharacterized protein n=1 Tax=Oryza barthii TaxID=65489 RepID=A0A0D3HIL5_9ORYZ
MWGMGPNGTQTQQQVRGDMHAPAGSHFFHFSNSWKKRQETNKHLIIKPNAIQPHKKGLPNDTAHIITAATQSAQGLSFGVRDNYKSRTMKKIAQKTELIRVKYINQRVHLTKLNYKADMHLFSASEAFKYIGQQN